MKPIDEFLNGDQENELSKQEVEKGSDPTPHADDLIIKPETTSKELAMADPRNALPPDDNALGEAAEDAISKRDDGK